jgi:hypothetical protein
MITCVLILAALVVLVAFDSTEPSRPGSSP